MGALTGKSRFRNAARGPINTPATGASERVLDERDLGNGSYYRRAYIEEAVEFSADASANLTTQLPASARVLFASLNLDTAVTLSTAVKIGLGTASDPDAYAITGTTMTKNTKTDHVPATATATTAAATTVKVTACDTSGAAAGTATGTVRARLLYEYVTSIADAA
jgi:hypothetical protein